MKICINNRWSQSLNAKMLKCQPSTMTKWLQVCKVRSFKVRRNFLQDLIAKSDNGSATTLSRLTLCKMTFSRTKNCQLFIDCRSAKSHSAAFYCAVWLWWVSFYFVPFWWMSWRRQWHLISLIFIIHANSFAIECKKVAVLVSIIR